MHIVLFFVVTLSSYHGTFVADDSAQHPDARPPESCDHFCSAGESIKTPNEENEKSILDAREAVELASLVLESDLLERTRKPISEKLRAFASDKEQDLDERRKVVFALGKLGDKESLDFLAEHIDTLIPVFISPVEMEESKRWAYYSALDSAGWDAIPAVLGQLKNKRSDAALKFYEKILCNKLGESAALALLKDELINAKGVVHSNNIIKIARPIQDRSSK